VKALRLLIAVEQARDKEEQRQHERQFGVSLGMDAEPEDSIDEPRGTSDEPDPGSFTHRFVLDVRAHPPLPRPTVHYTEDSALFALRREILSQRTFSIVKPDAVRKGHTGAILAQIEKAGFKIVSIKRMSISKAQAEGFYYVHAARPFFRELTEFMSSGPIFPMVLEKDNAIADLRKLMGATNPAQAEEGTIRKKFAASIGENAIHGSDAEETAAFEIGYFFAGIELK
jgi:nucleoside-diphosphate kinase